eukprot:CAMPEP_0170144222 /NCGR_PEP_ID=MMETSP0033_2-20121228/13364_1 /TAXON_ID=195969 /ORGANISM="Dolichomastix tenuilepis, Strain CCMP3274" /LENGTH=499 /DNA_ID=CAMNT_0010380709 /DNA_START=16 /DNA_END=1515 /DNA_ORIENTATION=+
MAVGARCRLSLCVRQRAQRVGTGERVGRRALQQSRTARASAAVADTSETADAQRPIEAASLGDIARFASPIALSTLSGPVLSGVDTAFVGNFSSVLELAALGPATTVSDLTTLAFGWIGVVLLSALSRTNALPPSDEREERYRDTVGAGLMLALGAGLFVLAWHAACATGLLKVLGASPEMMPSAVQYVVIRAVGIPLAFLTTSLVTLCTAMKDSLTPLMVTGVVVVANVVLDYVLCVPMHMGAAGAAWATVAAQLIGLASYIVVTLRMRRLRAVPPQRSSVASLLKSGVPIFAVASLTLSVYACMSAFSCLFPVTITATHKVVISIFALGGFFGEPLNLTCQAFLPQMLTAPRSKEQSAQIALLGKRILLSALGVAVVVAGAAAGNMLFFPTIFTQDPQVLAPLAAITPLVCGVLLLLVPVRALQGFCVAYRDLAFYALATFISAGLFAALLAATRMLGFGYPSLWYCTMAFYVVNFLVYGSRVHWLLRTGGPAPKAA